MKDKIWIPILVGVAATIIAAIIMAGPNRVGPRLPSERKVKKLIEEAWVSGFVEVEKLTGANSFRINEIEILDRGKWNRENKYQAIKCRIGFDFVPEESAEGAIYAWGLNLSGIKQGRNSLLLNPTLYKDDFGDWKIEFPKQ